MVPTTTTVATTTAPYTHHNVGLAVHRRWRSHVRDVRYNGRYCAVELQFNNAMLGNAERLQVMSVHLPSVVIEDKELLPRVTVMRFLLVLLLEAVYALNGKRPFVRCARG